MPRENVIDKTPHIPKCQNDVIRDYSTLDVAPKCFLKDIFLNPILRGHQEANKLASVTDYQVLLYYTCCLARRSPLPLKTMHTEKAHYVDGQLMQRWCTIQYHFATINNTPTARIQAWYNSNNLAYLSLLGFIGTTLSD